MSLNRSSETRRRWRAPLAVALAFLFAVSAVAAPAAAVDVETSGVSDSAKVGEELTATYELSKLYEDNPDEWTLEGETDLTDVTWTVTRYDQTDKQIGDTTTHTGASFSQTISDSDGVNEVEVEIQGTVPEIEKSEFSYDPAQTRVLAAFTGGQPGGASDEITNSTFRPYTEDSQSARDALDAAAQAIDDASAAGASTTEAEESFANAAEAFDSGEFNLATNLATEAQNRAESAQQSQSTTNLLLLGGGVLVVALVVVGAVYWYLQNRETYDRLG